MTQTEPASVHHEESGLALIADMVNSLVSGDPLEETLALICRKIRKLAGFRFCGVLVPDPEWKHFRLAGGHGFPPEYVERLNDLFLVAVGEQQRESPTRQAAELRRTVVNPNVLDVPSFVPWRSLAIQFGYRSMVSIPLLVDGEVIGVLNGYSTAPRTFTDAQLASIETLAAQAAVSLRVSLLMEARQETIRRLQESNATLEQQRFTLERAHEIHKRLTAAALTGTSATAVAQSLSELIQRPVAITYADGSIRCTSDGADQPGAFGSFMAALEVLATPAGIDVDRFPDGFLATVGEIRVPDERLGYVVIPRGDAASADLDERAVEHAATVLALEAVKERVVQATEDRLRSDFLTDLFRGRLDDEPDTAERAARHGLRLGAERRVVLVRIDAEPPAAPAGQPSGSLTEVPGDPRAFAQRELRRIPDSLVVGTGNTITAVIPAQAGADSVASIRTRLEAVQSRLRDSGTRVTLSAGIGPVASEVSEFASSHRDAELCLGLSRRVGRRGLILARDELGILGLFVDAKHPEDLLANARRVLGPALAHDTGKSGELILTLAAYLDHGCNVAGAAVDLFVHPNTVKYRLRRVEELCQLDLRNPDDLLQARIATLTLTLL